MVSSSTDTTRISTPHPTNFMPSFSMSLENKQTNKMQARQDKNHNLKEKANETPTLESTKLRIS